jgi:ParB family chromosome partitioning protein
MATAQLQAQVLDESEEMSQVCRIPRSQIRRFEGQPRTYFDPKELEDLAASIGEIKQQKPITVKVITGDPKHDFELVDGERRWIACGMAGVDTMLAWVRPIEDDDEQFIASVVSNFGSSDHTPLEISRAIDRIRKQKQNLSPGEQIARIAKVFVRSESWVYSYLYLLRLHPKVQEMMGPMVPEESRLGQALGIFISSLSPDLQLKVAEVVVEKKMSLNRARLYARQVAEEAGVKVGTNRGNVSGLPSKSWKCLRNAVKAVTERLDILLVPATQEALKKHNLTDRAAMAVEIEECIARLNQLRVSLIGTLPAPEVKSPRPALPSPPVSRLAVLPSPVLAYSKEQTVEVSHKILSLLFYMGKRPYVNLGRQYLQDALPGIPNLDVAVSRALQAGNIRWRVAPGGSEADERLIHLMRRFQQDYGDHQKFDDALKCAVERDSSTDPVSLRFKE